MAQYRQIRHSSAQRRTECGEHYQNASTFKIFFIYFLHSKLAKDSETSRFGFFVFVFVGEQSIQVMNSQREETQQTVNMRQQTSKRHSEEVSTRHQTVDMRHHTKTSDIVNDRQKTSHTSTRQCIVSIGHQTVGIGHQTVSMRHQTVGMRQHTASIGHHTSMRRIT